MIGIMWLFVGEVKAMGKCKDGLCSSCPYEFVYLGATEFSEYLESVSKDFNPAVSTGLGIRGYAEKLVSLGKVVAAMDRHIHCGIIAGYFNNLSQGFSFISAFHVRIPYRRMHIGRILMDKAVDISRRLGFTSVCLKVDKANCGGIGFYERYGFVKIGGDDAQFEMNLDL